MMLLVPFVLAISAGERGDEPGPAVFVPFAFSMSASEVVFEPGNAVFVPSTTK
jgi:hypothetical protein